MNSKDIICVCCYCDEDREHSNILVERGKKVSHGICQACYDIQTEIYEKSEKLLNN